MGEYKRPRTEAEFVENFAPKKPLMNATEAFYESSRCLFCYDAPCINACPTGIDIPLFIKQIHSKNLVGAARTIYDSNWLGNACGTVCPTEVLCEGACVYNHQDVLPLQIGRLQNYATSHVVQENKKLFTPGDKNGRKVAIIGAGPAGLACASELCVLGYDATIFESKSKPSGLTVHGIAPYKITNEEAVKEVDFLKEQLGFDIQFDTPVINRSHLEQLEEQYDALFIGIGSGPTRLLGIPGEEKENVVGAVEWIEKLRMKHHQLEVPKKVIVLGGGNTAMDAASESARMGAEEVVLAYRRSIESMGAYEFEYDLAKSSGVRSLFEVQPIAIKGNSKVSGVQFIRTENRDGKLTSIKGSEFAIDCDLVIKATGQARNESILNEINNLELDIKNCIKVNKSTFQTSNEKYFAGGDAVNGGAEVVNACYDGKMAARGIDEWLNQKNHA